MTCRIRRASYTIPPMLTRSPSPFQAYTRTMQERTGFSDNSKSKENPHIATSEPVRDAASGAHRPLLSWKHAVGMFVMAVQNKPSGQQQLGKGTIGPMGATLDSHGHRHRFVRTEFRSPFMSWPRGNLVQCIS